MKRTTWILCAVLGCDRAPESPPTTVTISASKPADAELPTPEDVCKAFVAMSHPPEVVTIAASATEGSIRNAPDGTGIKATVVELRAESGPVEQGQRRIDGVAVDRELTLKKEGGVWTVAADRAASRTEIFFVRKTPDHDPRKLFGASVIDRYGPKGGTACTLPAPAGPAGASAEEICAAFFASAASAEHTVLAASASPGFTAPEQGETRDVPTLAEGQAAATLQVLRVESKAAEGKVAHALVTVTENLLLAREGAAWKVAKTQPVFRGEFLRGEEPPDVPATKVFDDAELLARYKPTRGIACTLPPAK